MSKGLNPSYVLNCVVALAPRNDAAGILQCTLAVHVTDFGHSESGILCGKVSDDDRRLMMIDDISLQRIAQAVAKQDEIDRAEAGPKEPYESVLYKDITIASRYSVRHEFGTMRRVIDAMPELIVSRIESIWCDSKACACYTVTLSPRCYNDVVLDAVHAAFVKATGGWNGLTVYGDRGQARDFDCFWPADHAELA